MENCTQVLDDSFFDNLVGPALGRLKVATLLINGVSYDIFTGENVIGRDELSDIVLRSGMISSKHAVVEVEDWESHFLYDCGSTNKTRLGKVVLKPNVKYFLQGDEEIWFANFKAKYTKCQKPQTVEPDEDSGSETGSESMLNCAEAEESSHQANTSVKHDKPEVVDESRSVADSFTSFNSSSFVQEKKDLSSNQVVDGSIDDSTDDEEEFFIPPSQTVKEYNQKRFEQIKSSKVAEQICTEDVFGSTEVEEQKTHILTKTKAPLVDCSKDDIFEAETQAVNINDRHKQDLREPEENFDSQSLFNTECEMTVQTPSLDNKCKTSQFEAETQPLSTDVCEVSPQKTNNIEEKNIYEVETQINDLAQISLKEKDGRNVVENISDAETQINVVELAQNNSTEKVFGMEINHPAQINLKNQLKRNKVDDLYEEDTQINSLSQERNKGDENICEAETQINHLGLPNTKETSKHCETENIFETETQANVFVQPCNSKETIKTNEESDIFEAETQVNVVIQPGNSKEEMKTCEDINIFEAETQVNDLLRKGEKEDLEMSELVVSGAFTEDSTPERENEKQTHNSPTEEENNKVCPGGRFEVSKVNDHECLLNISEEPTQLLVINPDVLRKEDNEKKSSLQSISQQKIGEDEADIANALTQKNLCLTIGPKKSTEKILVESKGCNGKDNIEEECRLEDALTQVNERSKVIPRPPKVDIHDQSNLSVPSNKLLPLSGSKDDEENALTQINPNLKAAGSLDYKKEEPKEKLPLKQSFDNKNSKCQKAEADSKNKNLKVEHLSLQRTVLETNDQNCKLSDSDIAFYEQPTQLNLNILFEEDEPLEAMLTQPVEKYRAFNVENIEADETQLNIRVHKKLQTKRKLTDSELQSAETEPILPSSQNKEPDEGSNDTDIESEPSPNKHKICVPKDNLISEDNTIQNNSITSKEFGFDENSTESDSILASVPLDIDEMENNNPEGNKMEDNIKVPEKTAPEELLRASQEVSTIGKRQEQEETIAKSTITVADMDICSTVGNVYISVSENSKKIKDSPNTHCNTTLSLTETKTSLLKKSFKQLHNKIAPIDELLELNCKPSTIKNLFSTERSTLNDTMNQSLFFNQPCSSSTPFKVESNVNILKSSEQKINQQEILVNTPPEETAEMDDLNCSPVLPSTEELLAVADKTLEKINITVEKQKRESLPLALKRTPRAKKPSRKAVESLDCENDAKSNDASKDTAENGLKQRTKNSTYKKKDNKKKKPEKFSEELHISESCEKHILVDTKASNDRKTSPVKKQSKTYISNKNDEMTDEKIFSLEKAHSNSKMKIISVKNSSNNLSPEDMIIISPKITKSPRKNKIDSHNEALDSVDENKIEIDSKGSTNTSISNSQASCHKEISLCSPSKVPTTGEAHSDINSSTKDKNEPNNINIDSQGLRPTRASKRNHSKEERVKDNNKSTKRSTLENPDLSGSKEVESNDTNTKDNELQEPLKKSRRVARKEINSSQNNAFSAKKVSSGSKKTNLDLVECNLVIKTVEEEPLQIVETIKQGKKKRNVKKGKQSDTGSDADYECKLVENVVQEVGVQIKRKNFDDTEQFTDAKKSKLSKTKQIEINEMDSLAEIDSIKEMSKDTEAHLVTKQQNNVLCGVKQNTPKKKTRLAKINIKEPDKIDCSEDIKRECSKEKKQLEKSSKHKSELALKEEISNESVNCSTRPKQGNKTDGFNTDKESNVSTNKNQKPTQKDKRKLTADSEQLTPTKNSRSSRNKTSLHKQEDVLEEDNVNSQTRSRRTRAKPARFRDDEESLMPDSGSEKNSKRSVRSVLSNSAESINSIISEEGKIKNNQGNITFAKPAKNNSQKKAKQTENSVDVIDRGRTKNQIPIEDKGMRSRSGSQSSLSSVKSDASMISSLSSPRRSVKRGEQVLFTGLTNPVLETNIKKLGGSVVESPSDCSVLVTDKVRRTVKFLCVLAQGKPVVSPDWITHSWRCCRFEDPTDHLLLDSESQEKFSFKLAETIKAAKKQPLLTGYSVHATPSVKPPPDDIQSIVECCGGTYLKKVPAKWPERSFVISNAEDKSSWKKLKVKNITPPIVATEMLLSGILQHRIDFQTHKIK